MPACSARVISSSSSSSVGACTAKRTIDIDDDVSRARARVRFSVDAMTKLQAGGLPRARRSFRAGRSASSNSKPSQQPQGMLRNLTLFPCYLPSLWIALFLLVIISIIEIGHVVSRVLCGCVFGHLHERGALLRLEVVPALAPSQTRSSGCSDAWRRNSECHSCPGQSL